ncbi:MAG: cytoplasmic protein [Candidatus Methanofastidiosum sp.]|nr:cytoplasmic protein [Methanofastidiosum sp.]NYT04534.1 cytoplasmic protein [Candidatus Methanofastidiosa archaeon]NYT12933.1 cytoplasmic protein [Candidatus Methanofastidiosa archaeon]
MQRKVAIFAFNGDPMCIVHALINAIEFNAKGYDTKLIIEGSATGLIGKLNEPGNPLNYYYARVKDEGLIDCVCKACATKSGTIEEAKKQNLKLCDELFGHPSMARYMEEGYEIIAI